MKGVHERSDIFDLDLILNDAQRVGTLIERRISAGSQRDTVEHSA
jgi:hypothetical protein